MEFDKHGGRSYGPPGGADGVTVFIDDVSLPCANAWGDQPALELLRQLVEGNSCYNLAHDKRGESIRFEGMQVMALFSLDCPSDCPRVLLSCAMYLRSVCPRHGTNPRMVM